MEEIIWKRVSPGNYFSENERFKIKKEENEDAWYLQDREKPGYSWSHWTLRGAKEIARDLSLL